MRISRINFLSSLLSPVVFEDISKRNETSKSSLILGKCTDDWIKESGFLHDADLIFHSIRPAIQKEFKERKETKKKTQCWTFQLDCCWPSFLTQVSSGEKTTTTNQEPASSSPLLTHHLTSTLDAMTALFYSLLSLSLFSLQSEYSV